MRTQEPPTNNSQIERKILSNFRNGQAVFIQEDFMGKRHYRIVLAVPDLPYFRFSTAKKMFGLSTTSIAGDEMRAMRSQFYMDEYGKALKQEADAQNESRIVKPDGQGVLK